jgi:hypothetical protein
MRVLAIAAVAAGAFALYSVFERERKRWWVFTDHG